MNYNYATPTILRYDNMYVFLPQLDVYKLNVSENVNK